LQQISSFAGYFVDFAEFAALPQTDGGPIGPRSSHTNRGMRGSCADPLHDVNISEKFH
jgi:hypothetical protein